MDEDKKKKKKQKKKNKSNRVADERVEKAGGACSEEFQGSQGTDGISNNATRTLEAASKDKDEGEPRDLEKNEYDLQLCAPDTEEKFEKISELKDALEREVAYSQSLRIRLGFLEEQMTKRTIVEASTEEEIKRLKDEKKSQMQKEVGIEEEIKRLKEEKSSWLQKESSTEEEIKRLKAEKHSWLQKEACIEEEIQRLKAEKESWHQKEASTEEEVKRWTDENFHLRKEVEEMKQSLERLTLERRQLTAKMGAVQTGMQQLEREASVRARVEHDIAVASKPEASKRWLGWGSPKDLVAEAAGVAEDSCMQKEAAAAIVEKLVIENAELMEKVNELSAIVDQFNQRCSDLEESESRPQETTELDGTALSDAGCKEKSTDISLANGVVVKDKPRVSIENDHNTSQFESEVEVRASNEPVVKEHTENGLSMPNSIETVEEASVRESAEIVVQNISKESVPLSDAPLMGAPIRLFSFFAKYVSGADLVKPKNSVAG